MTTLYKEERPNWAW